MTKNDKRAEERDDWNPMASIMCVCQYVSLHTDCCVCYHLVFLKTVRSWVVTREWVDGKNGRNGGKFGKQHCMAHGAD